MRISKPRFPGTKKSPGTLICERIAGIMCNNDMIGNRNGRLTFVKINRFCVHLTSKANTAYSIQYEWEKQFLTKNHSLTNRPTYEELEQKVRHLENVLQRTQLPDFLKDKELFRLAFKNANIGMCLVGLAGHAMACPHRMACPHQPTC